MVLAVMFFTGMHHPAKAGGLPSACVSVRTLRGRRSGFTPPPRGWILDSGAFTELNLHGGYQRPAWEYAFEADLCRRLTPNLLAVVAQDYMCESFVLAKTGLTVADHQRLTIERYDALADTWSLLDDSNTPIMPVLQGWTPDDYVAHLHAYDDRLLPGMWVGVGSVCKRQGDPALILAVLSAIKKVRPDLRLHGFGVKRTALKDPRVTALLFSADSMAWSFAARYEGRDANSLAEAQAFHAEIVRLAA